MAALSASPSLKYSLPRPKRRSAPSFPAASNRSRPASARPSVDEAIASLVLQRRIGGAIDVVHGIDHVARRRCPRLSRDLGIEPAFGAAPVDDPLREFIDEVGEGEDLCTLSFRDFGQLERDLFLS